MANTLYKEHLIVATADYHPDERKWIPSIIISWKMDGRYQFHRIKGLPHFCDDKREAEKFAMEAAKAWVDKRL